MGPSYQILLLSGSGRVSSHKKAISIAFELCLLPIRYIFSVFWVCTASGHFFLVAVNVRSSLNFICLQRDNLMTFA